MIKYYYYARELTEIFITSKAENKTIIKTKEEVYIQCSKFDDKGYIIPLKVFCLSCRDDKTTYFFEINFPIKIRKEELDEITEEAFDKAYNKGIDECTPFPIPTTDNN